jgi:hypothetical protein
MKVSGCILGLFIEALTLTFQNEEEMKGEMAKTLLTALL